MSRHAEPHEGATAGSRVGAGAGADPGEVRVELADVHRTYTTPAGDVAVLYGSGTHGEPTAQDWAEAAGTISYEIVTRLGRQVPRVYVGADA